MDAKALEQKWKSIRSFGTGPYDSLRISHECTPELFMGLDVNRNRNLLLLVPLGVDVKCSPVKREHLGIEWHPETRFIVLSLNTRMFEDLFNELTISIHERIKNLANPNAYAEEFIFSFNRWADFFDSGESEMLSESAIKGIFGELFLLCWYIENTRERSPSSILNSWQGPFDRSHDFVFDNFNVEVKTKEADQVFVHISSEFQLQPEMGKGLELAVVNVIGSSDGLNIYDLISRIRQIALQQGADIAHFGRALSRAGIAGLSARKYDSLRWTVRKMVFFDCTPVEFPALRASTLPLGTKSVRYELNLNAITPFEKKQIDILWS